MFKTEIANDFVRKFAGDQTLHAEIDANNAAFTTVARDKSATDKCDSTSNPQTPMQALLDRIACVPEGVENAGYASVYDFLELVSGYPRNNIAELWSRICGKSDVLTNREDTNLDWNSLPSYPFRRGKLSPAAPFRELARIVHQVRSTGAATLQADIADAFCRKIAGDESLHAEIDKARETLAADTRRNLVKDIPSAARVCDDTPEPANQLRFARRSQLTPNTALTRRWIPVDISKSPGGYLGVLGEEVVDGRAGVRLKLGEAQIIEKRWYDTNAGHMSSAPHAFPIWAATPVHPRMTGHAIQECIKRVIRSDWCMRKGVIVVYGTSNEEYWAPADVVAEVVEHVTREVEASLGTDVMGCHAYWDAPAAPRPIGDATDMLRALEIEKASAEHQKEVRMHEIAADKEVRMRSIDANAKAETEKYKIKMLLTALADKQISEDTFVRLAGTIATCAGADV